MTSQASLSQASATNEALEEVFECVCVPVGGTIVIACWCQRKETPQTPLSAQEKDQLQFLYDEWAHPYFISNLEFGRLMEVSNECYLQQRQRPFLIILHFLYNFIPVVSAIATRLLPAPKMAYHYSMHCLNGSQRLPVLLINKAAEKHRCMITKADA